MTNDQIYAFFDATTTNTFTDFSSQFVVDNFWVMFLQITNEFWQDLVIASNNLMFQVVQGNISLTMP